MAANQQKEGETFEEWKARVDAWCQTNYGMGIDDLPDYVSLYDMYEDGVSPRVAATRVYRAAQDG